MASGGKRPGSGRKAGVPNKATQKRRDAALKALDGKITPLDFMLTTMRNEQAEPDIRFEAAKAAAPYVHPRLAAVEHTGKDGKDLVPQVSVQEQARALAFILTSGLQR